MTAQSETPIDGDDTPAPSRGGIFAAGYWLPLILVVGVLLGAVAGYLIPRDDSPADDSAAAGFARDMSTHHAQAVEMGMIAYTRAQNADVRQMARDIALTQQGQIGMMQAWLIEWKLEPTGSRPLMAWMPGGTASVRDGLMPGMATQAELQQLRTATGLEEDRLFLRLMIQHHLGGIHMAEEVAKLTDNQEVLDAAQLTINSQQREMTDMQSLQKAVGGTT